MKKQLKRLFRFLLALALVGLALILALRFGPQKPLREWMAHKLALQLGRQVEIGPLQIGGSGLTSESVRLSEIPDFKAGIFLTASHVSLGWNWTSLWKGFDLRRRTIRSTSGHLEIEELQHPHYLAKTISLRWSLTNIDPSLAHLTGWVALDQGTGLLKDTNQWISSSPAATVALAPLTALKSLEELGAIKIGLPNLQRWPIQSIKGRYQFTDGIMDIQVFELTSVDLLMTMDGAIELKDGRITAGIGIKSPPSTTVGALDIKAHVTGTLSNPHIDVETLKKKAFRASLSQILNNRQAVDVNKQLKNLFR